jgi:hypothetical protein
MMPHQETPKAAEVTKAAEVYQLAGGRYSVRLLTLCAAHGGKREEGENGGILWRFPDGSKLCAERKQ